MNPIQCNTLYDNGPEFSHHQKINHRLAAKSFFAHPYHSWERGSNENMNGLLRQYFPKGRSIKAISKTQISKITERLNNRPRKCLGYKTPNQVFNEEISDVALVG